MSASHEKFEFLVAIPARLASTRLSDKPLALVNGAPMIARVCEKALESDAKYVVACVDDEKIVKAICDHFGEVAEVIPEGNTIDMKAELMDGKGRLLVCLTSDKPRSGTERIAEMIERVKLDGNTIVVNVQGDEPLISKQHINDVAHVLYKSGKERAMSTLCAPITHLKDVFDPNCVKVVMNAAGEALYFSRAPIPYERDNFNKGEVTELRTTHYRHIGIYGYHARTVSWYLGLDATPLEVSESLEQLRALHHGCPIYVTITDSPPETGVDTAADLERVNAIFAKGKD